MPTLPPEYFADIEKLYEALLAWSREHPDADCKFRLPRDVVLIAPLTPDVIDMIALTEDARVLLRHLDEASSHRATVIQVRVALEKAGGLSTAEVTEVAATCPYCGAQIECVTDADGLDRKPIPGAFTICSKCAEVGVFTEGLGIRKAHGYEIAMLPPEALEQMTRHQANARRKGRRG